MAVKISSQNKKKAKEVNKMTFYDDNKDENLESTPVYTPEEKPVNAPQSFDDDNAVLYSGANAHNPTYDTEPRKTESAWSEPRFEPQRPQASYYTPGYSAPQPGWQQPAEKPKKEKKSHPFLRGVAVVLAAAIVSSAASFFTVSAVLDSRNVTGTSEVILGSARGESASPSVSVVSGEAMSANAIYQNAVNFQVVGITTSATTTNIWGQRSKSAVAGTGFVISSDGYIMTNYHVISYAVLYGGEITVMFEDGTTRTVGSDGIIGYSADNDVAVIKIDTDGLTLNPVVFGDSDSLIVGEEVYAVGNPLGELTYSMTPGIVSALDRVITIKDDSGATKAINMFQISAAVNHGNSGGPVYNSKGEVIGIVAAKYQDDGVEALGFAIPINDAVSIAKQVIEKGYVASAGLGIMCVNVSDYYQANAITQFGIPQGVIVSSVNAGGAAEKAGVKQDDIITAINGTTVTSLNELKLQLRRIAPGDEGEITVYRNKEYIDLKITFEELKSAVNERDVNMYTDNQQNDQQNDQQQDGTTDQYPSWYGTFPWSDFFGQRSQNGTY